MQEWESNLRTKKYIPESQRMNEHVTRYPTNQDKQYLNVEVLKSRSLHPHPGGNVLEVPAKWWQWWWWWWFHLHLSAPAPALSLPTLLTLFPWHITNLVMQPQLLGACAVNVILEIFPLKNSLFFTSVHLLVSLTLQDKLVQWNLGTWLTGGFGRARLTSRLNYLRGLLQRKWFYDSMIFLW